MEIISYTDEYLLLKLKEKYIKLGKTPTKDNINADKTMPNASTYRERFGGITRAYEQLGITPNVILDLSFDKVISLAQEYYKKYKTVPSVEDFNNTPNYPHSCYIREILKLKWNQFLILADLPIFTKGDNWIKNRKAELIVKKELLKQGYKVEDLSEENINASHAFIVDNKIKIDVRYSSPIKDQNCEFWKFRVHVASKKYLPDYFVCVGFNEFNQYDKMFLIPTRDITVREVISIRTDRVKNSKYGIYEVGEIKL